MKTAKYIYGIIKMDKAQEFGKIGIGNKEASNVLTIGFNDIAAVTSNSPLMAYDSLSKEKVVKDLATHQLVLEKVMERFTVIPVKFGTMVETENDVISFLEKGYALLSNQLSMAEGKIELDVVAWWELPKILAVISRHNDQIQEQQQKIAMKGEQISVEEKILVGQMIAQALKQEKDRYQQLMIQTLRQDTVDICLHDLANDEMVLNTACLLEKKKEESLHTAVQALDRALENTTNFRVVGPLPLYSFSTILFQRIDPESIEEAKQKLGLTGEVTEAVLRDAYHQLAKKYHPDKKNGGASPEFQSVHNAYRILQKFIENGSIYVEVYQWQKEMQ